MDFTSGEHPFDSAIFAMRELNKNVKVLQDTLFEEQQQRQNEVAELRQALEQERMERVLLFQESRNAMANESRQREATLDRLRHDLGDHRMATEKETSDLRGSHQDLSDALVREVQRLGDSLEELRQSSSMQLSELNGLLVAEAQARCDSVDDLARRVTTEVNQARSERQCITMDLAANTKKTQSDHIFLGMVSDAFATFKKAGSVDADNYDAHTAYGSPSIGGSTWRASPDASRTTFLDTPISPEADRVVQ